MLSSASVQSTLMLVGDDVLYKLTIYLLTNFVYLVMYIGVSCMEIKTEAHSNDITECSHYDKPTIGMFGFLHSM